MTDFIKKWSLPLLIFLAIFCAAFPLLARVDAGNPALAAPESYHNIRMAHAVKDNSFLETDNLQHRPYNFNIYHYLLVVLLAMGLPDQMLVLSSLALSLASAYFIYDSLGKAGLPREKPFLIMLVYFLSPLYTYVSTTATPYSLSIFLLALSFWAWVSEKNKYISMLPALLIILMEPLLFLTYILILLTHEYYKNKKYKAVAITAITALALLALLKLGIGYLPFFNLVGGPDPKHYVTDFGAVIGYGFFALLLGIVTIILFWKKLKVANIFILLMLSLSAFIPTSRIALNLVLCTYAGTGIYFFLQRKWALPMLKELTLMLIFLSILFSSISFTTRMGTLEPTQQTIEIMDAIKESGRKGVIFGDAKEGFLIEYFAKHPAYLDEESKFYSDYGKKLQKEIQILTSRTPSNTKLLLDSEEITYIYVTPELRKRTKELFLVLGISENFIKIAEFEDKEAWLYIRT